MSPIDLSCEDLGGEASGGWKILIPSLCELGEVTLGGDEDDGVELVLDLGEAKHSDTQNCRAHCYYYHSEGEAPVTVSHHITTELRESF